MHKKNRACGKSCHVLFFLCRMINTAPTEPTRVPLCPSHCTVRSFFFSQPIVAIHAPLFPHILVWNYIWLNISS